MKKYIMIGILFAFPFCLSADEPVKAIYAKITNPDNKEITVVAHRADWRYAPENSLAAIESSIRLGADVVELDVQKTKDGQLILMHDKTLDRTTTGKGKVAEWTLDSDTLSEEWSGTQNQASCTYFGRGFMGCQRSCDGQSG